MFAFVANEPQNIEVIEGSGNEEHYHAAEIVSADNCRGLMAGHFEAGHKSQETDSVCGDQRPADLVPRQTIDG